MDEQDELWWRGVWVVDYHYEVIFTKDIEISGDCLQELEPEIILSNRLSDDLVGCAGERRLLVDAG